MATSALGISEVAKCVVRVPRRSWPVSALVGERSYLHLLQAQMPSQIEDPDQLQDCPPGRRKQFPHGVLPSQGVVYTEEQLWKSGKDRDSVLTREPSSPTYMKGYPDSGKCLYDSGRTDSGFLSGANIVSEQGLSSDDISSSRKFTDSSIQEDCKENTQSLMRLDSGVDVNEQFSSLSLTSTNDLNATPSKSHSQDSGTTTFTNINVPTSPTTKAAPANVEQPQTSRQPVAVQPWELYYQQDDDGDTQLHISIIQEFIEVVYSLIQMAPHPCLLDIHNYDCQTPLHLAVLTRQPRIVRRLIVAGATVDLRDRVGNTALHLACQTGDFDCVRALTEPVTVAETAAANLRYHAYSHQVPQNLEERNYDGLMCVHLAAVSGNVDVLRHLVWFGANINAKDGKSGRTPLHLAVELGLRGVALFLVEELSAALQLEACTYAGLTAYQLAAAADHALARTLQQRGALPHPPPDSDDDSDLDDEEMYRLPSDGTFSGLGVNGQPLDIGA